MIQYFIRRACGTVLFKPRVIICVPSGITEVEERAVVDAATQAGAKKHVPHRRACCGGDRRGHRCFDAERLILIVDIGGGDTTDIAVISLNGVVVSESIKVAGDKFDEAIIRYVRKHHNVHIGERTAEAIKIKVGSVWEREEPCWVEARGKMRYTGTSAPCACKLDLRCPRLLRSRSRR